MALKIRLRRTGAKKQPAYRIVVADARAPRDGRFVEILGMYNPLTAPSTVQVNAERALYWLRTGAQPSDVVKRLFTNEGVWAQFTGEAAPVAAAPAEEVAPAVEETVAPVEEAAAPAEETAAPVEEAEAPAEETPAPADETPAAE